MLIYCNHVHSNFFGYVQLHITYSSPSRCVGGLPPNGWLNFLEDFCVSGSDAGPLLVSANDHCLKVGGFEKSQGDSGLAPVSCLFFWSEHLWCSALRSQIFGKSSIEYQFSFEHMFEVSSLCELKCKELLKWNGMQWNEMEWMNAHEEVHVLTSI